MIRQKKCPECGSTKITVLERRGPHSVNLPNDDATLKCVDCSHQWEGTVVNPERLRKMRRRGARI